MKHDERCLKPPPSLPRFALANPSQTFLDITCSPSAVGDQHIESSQHQCKCHWIIYRWFWSIYGGFRWILPIQTSINPRIFDRFPTAQRGFLAWPCVCARGVDKTPRHAKHKPLGEPLRPIGADWADWAEKSIEKSIGLKAARNLPWVYGGPEFVPWPNFRTKQPHLPQVALPRHAMMARANVWVCFGTGEDPTKLFGIHEQAIDAKHLGQLWIWWCYSPCQNTLLLFSFYSTPLKRKFDRRYAEPLWEYRRVHTPVSLSFYQYSVSQCFADPSQSNICALQLPEVPGKQCSWQGGSDTPPNLVRILPTSTRDEIHKNKCRAIFLMFLL